MAASRDAVVAKALAQFSAATGMEQQLDVAARTRSALDPRDAVVLAGNATDYYLASCAALMGALPRFVDDKRVQALLARNIAFMMARIEGLQELLQRRGDPSHRVSLTSQELEQRRQRARLSQPTDSNETTRARVAREIFETERSYVKALEQLQQHYIVPLTAGSDPVLSAADKSSVFGNVEEIMGFAHSFLQALEIKVRGWSARQTLGDTFKSHSPFFKIYVMYTNSYQAGAKRMGELKKSDPRFLAITQAAASAGCPDILSLMITPVQRLPRYVLLLKELRKRTADGHPDSSLVEAALADIRVVADYVNERLRSHEDNAKMLEIQSALWSAKLGGVPVTLLAPGRTFVREGKMMKLRSIGTFREVHVFLFSDILMYCTSSRMWPGRFHYHNHLEFYGASSGEEEARRRNARHPRMGCALTVTSAQAVRLFIADSLAERNEWVADINRCAELKRDLDKRRNSARMSLSSVRSSSSSSSAFSS